MVEIVGGFLRRLCTCANNRAPLVAKLINALTTSSRAPLLRFRQLQNLRRPKDGKIAVRQSDCLNVVAGIEIHSWAERGIAPNASDAPTVPHFS